MVCSSRAALEQQQKLQGAGCLPWHAMRDAFKPCSTGWAQGVSPVLHPCWRADGAAPGEERAGTAVWASPCSCCYSQQLVPS